MLSIVLPCRGEEDIARVQKNLVPSILKFLDTKDFDELIVICEEETKNNLQPILSCLSSKLKVRFVLDSELITKECRLYSWGRQQLLKLLSCNLVKSDWFLTVDSDCYFIRNSSIRDFISPDSTAYTPLGRKTQKKWWEASAKYLNMPEPDIYCYVTPFILNRQVCSDLCSTYNVEDAIHSGATEYTLYWTYLCNTHTHTDYYTRGELSGRCIWVSSDEDITKIIKRQFSNDYQHPMSLTQSRIGFDESLINLIHEEITNK